MTGKKARPTKSTRRVAEPAAPPIAPAAVEQRAKLFWNGRSQAVRLPREYRFEGEEVRIRRDGERVILEPVKRRGWPAGYWERLRALTRDFQFPEVEPVGGRLMDVSLDDVT